MTRGTRRLLIVILAVLTLLNAVAVLQLLRSFSIQLAPAVAYPPLARILYNSFWTLLFLWLIFRLLRRPRAAIRSAPPLLTLYGIANVIWLALFARADYDRNRIAFQIVFTGLLLIPVWLVCRDRLPPNNNAKVLPPQSSPGSAVEPPLQPGA